MKVLWIDDDSYRTRELKEILELYGYEINFHDTCKSGFDLIKSDPESIDIIILDVMMPSDSLFNDIRRTNDRTTGLLLYQRIREIFSGPILLYTVNRDKSIIDKYIKNDKKAAYLKKPSHEEDIIKTLQRISE